ncbi:TauD/TfdA family dioxygenase [Nocardioides sp. CFH 31398]|uniref:TauD/TfdA dioxygenase family protein n=1 Tax=Nocardioides sp. CFH 31398 TaxID=2919579 RepID=UPI001F061E74|nr:TauD/TfdA family dioxygenase [Nocardioides sp. CFH 31398]MCH1865761.1 TauD/TfdA family dioxygenase [Nocardioides sp. CFH 31398]
MDVQVLEPLGARVTGLSLDTPPDEATVEAIVGLLADHGVVHLPGQDIDDTAFAAYLRCFGDPVFTVGETPVPGFDDLNVISNVGRTTPPRSTFHVDTSYVSSPPAYTSLRAVTIPEQGGQTVFTNQYRALDTLPADLRARIEGRRMRHVVTGVDPGESQEKEAWHPLVRPHPVSGRDTLYLTTPARCAEIEGMDADETAETVAALTAHSTAPENCLRHTWASGDVVMWDNGTVLHAADHSGVVGDRVMHRGMATGYAAPLTGTLSE